MLISIGIRLMFGSDARRFIANSTNYDYDTTDKLMKIWKKQKSISLDNTGYRKYFWSVIYRSCK